MITSGFNTQLVPIPSINRASLTGFHPVSAVSLLGPARTRRFYHSLPNSQQTPHTLGRVARGVVTTVILGSCLCFYIFGGKIERVPYTNRLHYTLSDKLENKLNEYRWEWFDNRKRIFPKSDPDVIRAETIARRLLDAMNKGLMLQHQSSESSKLLIKHNAHVESKKLLSKPATKHLDGKVWQVCVTYSGDDCWLLDGKIVVPDTSCSNLKSDAELATVIAHEIGHHVARHFAEGSMKMFLSINLPLLIFLIGASSSSVLLLLFAIAVGGTSFLSVPVALRFFSRRREAEADYIGLMLMASAGYDPQVAPYVYEYLDRHRSSTSNWFDLNLKSYPGKKRGKLLKKPETMEQAKQIFEEVKAGKGVRSFV
ncbi:hypothetical protein PTKIN_Ptkin12aG0196400 [Pterospermum kingtungense]